MLLKKIVLLIVSLGLFVVGCSRAQEEIPIEHFDMNVAECESCHTFKGIQKPNATMTSPCAKTCHDNTSSISFAPQIASGDTSYKPVKKCIEGYIFVEYKDQLVQLLISIDGVLLPKECDNGRRI